MTTATATEQDGELPRRVVIATMAGVVVSMLLGALDGTIVGTAMPRVIQDLHGFEHYAYVTTIYMLTSTTVVPIVGKLSDLFGRKVFLLFGVVLFVGASAACGAATTMTQLIVFRGIQGIGGGFTQSMAFITIADLFPPAKRGRVSGLMGSVFGLASIIGPAVGGFLTDGPGWRWCFLVNVPVGIIAFAVLARYFPSKPRATTRPRIDWLGAMTLVLGVVPLLLGVSWGGRDYPWTSPLIDGLIVGGVVMLAAFLFVESRADEALMPPRLFRDRVVWTSSLAATLMSACMFGAMMFIPLFIQNVVGVNATRSGAAVTPMMFAMIAASITAGQIMTRTGRYKWVAVVGVSIAAGGLFLLSRMDTSTTYGTVLFYMVIMGLGLGVTMPVFNLSIQNAVDVKDVAVATSAVQFLRSMGGSIGAAIFGAILASRFTPGDFAGHPDLARAGLASAVTFVFLIAAFVVVAATTVTLFLPDRELRKTNKMGPSGPAVAPAE